MDATNATHFWVQQKEDRHNKNIEHLNNMKKEFKESKNDCVL